MPYTQAERAYVESARVGRLATADAGGRPSVVPLCYAMVDEALVSPLDEKPKEGDLRDLRRVRDIRENAAVAVVVDEYSEAWEDLWWVQVRGRARVVEPGAEGHWDAVVALREKYDQYADHALGERPLVWVSPGHVRSWGLE
jgi:PPOX class probable F420-dependent enzyme